jgi:hypothetical protein
MKGANFVDLVLYDPVFGGKLIDKEFIFVVQRASPDYPLNNSGGQNNFTSNRKLRPWFMSRNRRAKQPSIRYSKLSALDLSILLYLLETHLPQKVHRIPRRITAPSRAGLWTLNAEFATRGVCARRGGVDPSLSYAP